MPKIFKSIFLILFLLFFCSTFIFAEDITFTTYYPSPYGSYRELRSQREGIGPTYSNRTVVCWDPPCPIGSTDVSVANPDLLVEGNVGIGTIAPIAELHVHSSTSQGRILISGASDSGATYSALYLGRETNAPPNTWVLAHKKATGTSMEDGFQIAKWSGASCFGFLNILTNGNVGIGTTAPAYKLQIETTGADGISIKAPPSYPNDAGDIVFNKNNQSQIARIWTDPSNSSLYLGSGPTGATGATGLLIVMANGNIGGNFGSYHVASDMRLKKEVVTIPNALNKVLALRGVNFKWKNSSQNDGNFHMGMIAQEVEKVVPEVVHTADDAIKTKAVEYQYMVGLLVEAIKEQQKMIDELKMEIKELKLTKN